MRSIIIILLCFPLSVEGLSTCLIKQNNRYKATFYQFIDVDSLPILTYKNITRSLQPYVQLVNDKPKYIKDSLLSVFIEENIHCSLPCEGRFLYTLELKISKLGLIDKVTFIEDENNSEILREQIEKVLSLIEYKPAIKNSKTVSFVARVKVFIDLYNYPSSMKKRLFNLCGNASEGR